MYSELETEQSLTGQILDQKYEVRQQLGRGGSGAVYLARHVYMERDVAIKLLHPSLARDENLRSRFFREARLTSLLRHPNIVTVHDFGVSNGMPYLVMEYVDGMTLRSYLNENGALGLPELTSIGIQICEALSAAHEMGVVHRDLKPENVLLIRDGKSLSVRVLDFGIAKIFEESERTCSHDTQLTEEGVFHGTPRYAPPEQIRNQQIDGRADIYSFGVMLYELILGCPPFDSSSSMEVALMHLNSAVIPPRERDTTQACPESLEALIMKCLKKDPAERFASASEMLEALERFGRNEQVLPPEQSRVRFLAAALGTLMLCLVVFHSTISSAARPPVIEILLPTTPIGPVVQPPSPDDQLNAILIEGEKAFHEDRFSDAAPMLRSVLAKRPNDATAKVYLALCYKKTGRFDESIALLESLDSSLQSDQKVSYQLALLNAKIGKMDLALQHLADAAKGNKEIKAKAKKEAEFVKLSEDPHYKKEYKKIMSEERVAKEVPPPKLPGTKVERLFGHALEGVNHGIHWVFG